MNPVELELVSLFSKIRDLRGEQSVLMDFLHAAEELGEIGTELKKDQSDKIDVNIREECVDLLICALSAYIGSQGKIEDLLPLVRKKLLKWETSKNIVGLYSDPIGVTLEIREVDHGLYRGFNSQGLTWNKEPVSAEELTGMIKIFRYKKIQN